MRPSIAWLCRAGGSICALLASVLLISACKDARLETVSSGLTVRYLKACAPARVEAVTVEALGDFPTDATSFAAIDVAAGTQTLDRLPVATRLYRLRVTTPDFDGVAIARAAGDDLSFDALVLPRGEPCLSIAQASLLRPGAAVGLSGDDDLLLAGGEDDGVGRSEVRRLHANEARLTRVEPGLFVPRSSASAVRAGGETWILGGVQALTAGTRALDSFERYDPDTNELSSLGRLSVARSELAALTLTGGDVLVAGGRASQAGKAVDSLERIAGTNGESRELQARLPWPLANGRLLERDDGSVVIVGADRQTLLLALFDPASDTVEEIALPALESTPELVVTLPGARIGCFEIDDAGATSGALVVRLADGESVHLEGSLTSFAGISQGRATTLHDGQVVVTGLRDGQPTARVIDPGTLAVRAISLAALPERLLVRDDGALLLLGADSLSLLRSDERTPYDNPGGTLLASDTSVLAIDAAGRFTREGLALRANSSGARLDLAGLSYERVEIELDTKGKVALLLRREAGAERAIQLSDAEVGPALCTLQRKPGERVRITRDAEQIRIESGGASRRCRLDGLTGRIRLGVRALEEGAYVQRLVVTRRPQ